MEASSYYAQKEQLVAQIDSLIQELEQLRPSGQKERILAVTNLLEERLRALAALQPIKDIGNRRRQW